MESAHRPDPAAGECLASVGQHPQRFELAVDLEHPQVRCAHCHDRDRVGVECICLAVVAGVEEPHPGGELRGDIDDVLAGLEEPLSEWTACAVGALDRPDPVRRGRHRYYELGSPLLSHASSRCPAGRRPKEGHTRERVGSPEESGPAGHLDRVWPDTGPTGIV